MDHLLERLPSGSRVVVIRLRSLGDCVLTTPALALLKAHRPDLKITVVVEPRFAAVFHGNPDVESEPPCVSMRTDLVLNLHGGTRSMALTAMSKAKFRAGFAHHRYSFLYSTRIPTAQEILGETRPMHTAEHLASAMFYLGVPRTPIPRARLFASAPPDLPAYVVIHPFASAPDKTWPAGRFTAVALHFKEKLGLEPVFVAGPQDDPAPFSPFRVWRNQSIESVKSLLAGAQMFVGNDSGPAHIAAAFGLPVVVLFGASDPAIWAPWRTEAQVLTASQGIAGIAVEDALAAIETHRVKA